MAVPVGYSTTNSGAMAFLYNNLQAPLQNVNSANANAVGVTPLIQGFEPQGANFQSARQPGGIAYRGPTNVNFPGGNAAVAVNGATVVAIGGDLGIAAARMGYTKGGGLLIASNSNGTTAKTFDTTNTQVNTNGFWGDTTFATINVMIFHNLSGIDGVSSGNGAWYVNGGATNGLGLDTNANSTLVVQPNGGVFMITDPNGINSAAANCKVLCTPVNGGVLGVALYGS